MESLKNQLAALVEEWLTANYLKTNQLFVIGCSTSEVAGERIGTNGSEKIAADIFRAMDKLKQETGIQLAYQCCEHLNRALVVERRTMMERGYEQVAAIPVRKAGGSMASYAYKNFSDPVLVEQIKADAGIDIGETMIGMHLKRVAVPLRFNQKQIGNARVNGARTRPKLIGGERAVYNNDQAGVICE